MGFFGVKVGVIKNEFTMVYKKRVKFGYNLRIFVKHGIIG